MTRFRRIARSTVFALVTGIAACATDSTDAQVQAIVNSIVLDLGPGKLAVGQTLKAQAILHDGTGTAISGTKVTWASSNTDVATVRSDGTITAVNPGTSDISASAGIYSEKATLAVVSDNGTGGNPVVATRVVIIQQPTDVMNGVTITPAPSVELHDADNNRVAGVDQLVTATIASGAGTIAGNTAMSVDGMATFSDLRITGTGAFTVTFSAVGLSAATSSGFTVTGVQTTQLRVGTQPSTSSQNGQALGRQPTVQLVDASGNNVARSGVVVAAAIDTDATLGGATTATTDASGVATFTNLSISGKSGPKKLKFSSPGLSPATSDPVVVTPGPAVAVSITTQPSSSAASGQVFGQQPVIQLLDASGNAVTQSGVVITASIATGGGTLGGTTTATTNASGAASFTNLSITGADGARTISFTAPLLTSATSNPISIGAVSTGALYPNRPAAFANSTEIDFSQTPAVSPAANDQIDNQIAGTDWKMIFFSSHWSKATDASAPQSAPSIWQGYWPAGDYGNSTTGGHGIGNVFTYGPGNVFLNSGTSRLYMSLRVKFDFDAAYWHPISNKFVNLSGDHSQILMQLNEGGNWRHAEELGSGGQYTSFFVDNGRSVPGEAHLPGQVGNPAVPTRKWVQLELLIDIPNHIYKIWQDGVLTTDATPTFASTKINTVGIYAFRGGGGEQLLADLYYKYDHFFIAW